MIYSILLHKNKSMRFIGRKLTDKEMIDTKGGKYIFTCINGEWVYIDSETGKIVKPKNNS